MKVMYDIILVGAGLTSATICGALKHRYKILVLDTRDHLGGNCYDYNSSGTIIHRYGPHIFHSPSGGPVDFLSKFTDWIPYEHRVAAELEDGRRVPFPYSEETVKELGAPMSPQEVIDVFFKPYSMKMWGVEWDKLPDIIKNRIPKDAKEKSDYFANQFTAFPKRGYTVMMQKMFHGVELVLGTSPDHWMNYLDCGTIIYCGRPDRIKLKNGLYAGGLHGDWLTYRNLEFKFNAEPWDAQTAVVNFCHNKTPYTRKTSFKSVLGGESSLVTYEKAIPAFVTDQNPFYFYPTEENTARHLKIRSIIQEQYPQLLLAGRLGTSSYIDMWQCVQMGLGIAQKLS
jgi:UDP-galactopyranose mutase